MLPTVHLNDTGYQERPLTIDTDNILKWGLLYAKDNDNIVSVELDHSSIYDVAGFVDSIDENTCTINQADEYGIKDGEGYFSLNDVSEIWSCFH